jgi:two-component system sensor histidine kinase QseC
MKKTNYYSLKGLLLFTLLTTTIVTWGITAFISYQEVRAEVYDLFDDELAQSAKVIHAFVESLLHNKTLYEDWDLDAGISMLEENIGKNKYEHKVAFQLWMTKQGLILRSKNAPTFAFSETKNGFSKITIDEQPWDVFSMQNKDQDGDETYVIHVAQHTDIRKQLTEKIAFLVYKQALVSLPVLLLMIWLIVGYALRPIKSLTNQLKHRKLNYLKPLSIKKLPVELAPILNSLNDLFTRLEHAFESERRFTADASHELRTPLAGLLTQSQVALKAKDEATQHRALMQIEKAVFRMTHMLEQLLVLSRLESGSSEVEKELLNITDTINQVLTDLAHLADKKNTDIEISIDSNRLISANSGLLYVLIRNIIHNAILYSPKNGQVSIKISANEKNIVLAVHDSGPGIPLEHREQVMQRFFRRVETANTTTGSGLGLSIVSNISTIHNAQIKLGQSDLGGLKFEINFPIIKRRST